MTKCPHGHDGYQRATAGADEISSCCQAAVSYYDDGFGDWVLCCKCCKAMVDSPEVEAGAVTIVLERK